MHYTIIYCVHVHTHVEVGIQFHSFLILALDGGSSIKLHQIIIYKFYHRYQHSFCRTCRLEMLKQNCLYSTTSSPFSLNKLAQVAMLVPCIQKVLHSNHRQETTYPLFTISSSIPGFYLKCGHVCFLHILSISVITFYSASYCHSA